MCGIAGIISLSSIIPNQENVRKMCIFMRHRGPDTGNIYAKNNFCFGHQRLSIIDLSAAANQPMLSQNGKIVVVLNGEIYNYKSLKKELADYPFQSSSDTEVLIAAYQKWGIAMINHLEGMFAFALADVEKNEVYLGRDRFGKKPLYFVQNKEHIAFASEMRPLLKTGLSNAKINKEALSYYLQYQTVHYPETMVQDIAMLEPGSYLRIIDTKADITKYWNEQKIETNQPFESKKLESLFDEAVEKRLMSDVPLAILLSAGIDSNLILAAASRIRQMDSFTIGFQEKDFDESVLAAKSAKHFGSKHHEVMLSANDLMEKMPSVLDAMDHPSGDGPNTFLISEMIKKAGFTVALSGLGGDEVFFGYPHYQLFDKMQGNWGFKNSPKILLGGLSKVAKSNKFNKLAEVHKELNNPAAAMAAFRSNYNEDMLLQDFGLSATVFNNEPYLGLDKYNTISMMEMEYYMCDILLRDADQMSMAHSVELRNPFLDHSLVSYVWSINAKEKSFKPAKKLLLDTFGSQIPDYILHKKKTGFTFPWDNWMRNELNSFCESQLLFLEQTQLFKQGSILAAWQAFNNHSKIYTWSRIWALVALAYWINKQEIDTK